MKKDRNSPLYMIRVVCNMLHVHPQTLRLYEREGLITPKRLNRFRFYSDEDIERLSLILKLTRELGVNKAGVEIILRMKERMQEIQEIIDEMMDFLDKERREYFSKRLTSLINLKKED